MATTTNLLHWDAFERLPNDGMHREILEGELIVLPPPKSGHSEVARRMSRALQAVLEDRRLGRVYMEAGYRLSVDPATWVQPDVSFLREERARATPDDGYFSGSPDLAVEVISPSESAEDVERKVALLLAHGSEAVWVCYPRTRTVRVSFKDGSSKVLGVDDALTLADLLPGWALPIRSLFEA
jgi:Uma2 family endonuclease